jgi:hypothetical protein
MLVNNIDLHFGLPILILLKLRLNHINTRFLSLKVILKIEFDVEIVNFPALLSFLSLFLKTSEICLHLVGNLLPHLIVFSRLENDEFESWGGIGHKAMDMVLEIRLSSDTVDLVSARTHVQ